MQLRPVMLTVDQRYDLNGYEYNGYNGLNAAEKCLGLGLIKLCITILFVSSDRKWNIMLMRDLVFPKNSLALSIVVNWMKEEGIFLTAKGI